VLFDLKGRLDGGRGFALPPINPDAPRGRGPVEPFVPFNPTGTKAVIASL